MIEILTLSQENLIRGTSRLRPALIVSVNFDDIENNDMENSIFFYKNISGEKTFFRFPNFCNDASSYYQDEEGTIYYQILEYFDITKEYNRKEKIKQILSK